MFDYVENAFNPHPELVTQAQMNSQCLYIEYMSAPVLTLPPDMAAFLASHKKKFWYNLNRLEKIYKKEVGELHFDVLQDRESLSEFLDQVFVLFNTRWQDEYVSSPWKTREGFHRYKKAMMDLAETDNAFLAVLYDEDRRLLSYGYCLTQGDTVYFYQHTTDPRSELRRYSLGKVLIHNLLKHLIANRQYKRFDFMTGEHPYKKEWTQDSRQIYLKVEGKNPKSFAKYLLLRLKTYIQFSDLFRNHAKTVLKNREKLLTKLRTESRMCMQ